MLMNVFADASKLPLPNHYPGKVRDVYDLGDSRLLMATSDRLSAYNRSITSVPHKGAIINAITKFWFEQTQDICPNAVLDYPDPNIIVMKKLDMLPLEIIVRGYMTGSSATSIWTMYKDGKREMYGHSFPDGMIKNQILEKNIVTPTRKTKDDEPITPAEIMDERILAPEMWEEVHDTALALFARGQEIAARRGLILVDTKYEFGMDDKGRLLLADEIHTPDSSRYWIQDTYSARFADKQEPDSLDKEFVRLWLTDRMEDPYKSSLPRITESDLAMFSGKYQSLYQHVTGKQFVPEPSAHVEERILKNIQPYIPSV